MKKIFPLFLLTLIVGCSKDDNPVVPPVADTQHGVYILNEGNFNQNNASLSLYLPDSNKVYADVFQSANGSKLGDTGNSMTIHDGKAYIVVNGSNVVKIIDTKTQKQTGTIALPAGSSPRHLVCSAAHAYITNLYANTVSVVDLATKSIVASIPVGANPEELLLSGNTLLVANSGFGKGNTVSVIDLATNSVVKSLRVGDNPQHIRSMPAQKAVVLSVGDFGDFSNPNDDTPGKLHIIDLTTMTVSDSMTIGGHPFELTLDNSGNAYTIGLNGVMKISLSLEKVMNDKFVAGNCYTVAFDASRSVFYVTDPKDFVQPGVMKVVDLNGNELRSYQVGINPGWIAVF